MKTQGVPVCDGHLVLRPGRAVPEAFWARLKHELAKRGLLDEFRHDYARSRDDFEQDAVGEWSRLAVAVEHEERFFRRWVERVLGPQTRWPWTSGWDEEAVDSYLSPATAPAPHRAAAVDAHETGRSTP